MRRRRWKPAVVARGVIGFGGELPEPGQLIAHWGSRKAWRVIRVEERAQANWRAETMEAWRRAGEPDSETWEGRERAVHAEPARDARQDGKDRRGLPLYPWAYETQWWPLPDPYPACVDCGNLWPCPCDDRNHVAAEAMKELERLGQIMPGCCWACGKPLSSRHHSVSFAGENLLLPGGGPVAFHSARSRKASEHAWGTRTCRNAAEDYEKRWLEAEPGRLPRLTCPGQMWRHPDRAECTAGEHCPGSGATHEDSHHCAVSTWTHVEMTAVQLTPPTNCGHRDCRGPAVPQADQVKHRRGLS